MVAQNKYTGYFKDAIAREEQDAQAKGGDRSAEGQDEVSAQGLTGRSRVVSSSKSKKSAAAFRTISEVADDLGVQQHVLRFWETKFTQVKPLKRGGGRRYYRPEDVALLKTIYDLLYTQGYTIKGAQKLLKGQGKQQIISGDLAPAEAKKTVEAAEKATSAPAKEESRPVEAEKTASAATVSPLASEEETVVAHTGLSDKQRSILKAMLGDLKDLRNMIRSEIDGGE